MVAHIAATLLVGFVLYTAVPGSSLFSWHPSLMIIAMVLLMYEAILVFSRESSLFTKYSHMTKANIHGYMMAGAVFCAGGGFAAIYVNKERFNKSHFTSWHGLLGVCTLGFICLQTMGGLCLKYNSILRKLAIRLVDMKLYHATSGLVVFTCVVSSILLGMYSDWFSGVTSATTWYGCMACLSCIAMYVMQQITTEYLPKSRYPARQPSQTTNNKSKDLKAKSKSKKAK